MPGPGIPPNRDPRVVHRWAFWPWGGVGNLVNILKMPEIVWNFLFRWWYKIKHKISPIWPLPFGTTQVSFSCIAPKCLKIYVLTWHVPTFSPRARSSNGWNFLQGSQIAPCTCAVLGMFPANLIYYTVTRRSRARENLTGMIYSHLRDLRYFAVGGWACKPLVWCPHKNI